MWIFFCKCFLGGLGLMLGLEIALGLCIAAGSINRGGDNK